MTQDIRLLSGLFAFFSRHRWVLFACTLLVVAGAAFVSPAVLFELVPENVATVAGFGEAGPGSATPATTEMAGITLFEI